MTQVHLHWLRRAAITFLPTLCPRISKNFGFSGIKSSLKKYGMLTSSPSWQQRTQMISLFFCWKEVKGGRTCQNRALIQSHGTTLLDLMLLEIFIFSAKLDATVGRKSCKTGSQQFRSPCQLCECNHSKKKNPNYSSNILGNRHLTAPKPKF